MDEKQSFERIEEGLKMASGAARQMAHHRKDENWLTVSYLLEETQKKCKVLLISSEMKKKREFLT